MATELDFLNSKPAEQQPGWSDTELLRRVTTDLAARPPVVQAEDVHALRPVLAEVAAGGAHVIQIGDCAEDPAESTWDDVNKKAGLTDMLAGTLKRITGTPVVRVGRIGGQFAKPRSKPTEQVGDLELPAYRGHLVNGPEPDPERRRPDPARLLSGYEAACGVTGVLGWRDGLSRSPADAPLWTSHEALVLDYEVPMVRQDGDNGLLLKSTHWPWVGNRTRQLDGAHIALLSSIVNPVACKVGPDITEDGLLALCERLDPHRSPGRLTLIARMGAESVTDRLPALVAAVRRAGHPVIWLTDPMHGNTTKAPGGLKTRYVDTITGEVQAFQAAVTESGGVAGGLHLEATPDSVTECVQDESCAGQVGEKYTTFCDPRLNPEQAQSVVSAWQG